MTDITNLTTQTKSVLLARAMGWRVRRDSATSSVRMVDAVGETLYVHAYTADVGQYTYEQVVHDLYYSINAYLAWRAINYVAYHYKTAYEFAEWWDAEQFECFIHPLDEVIAPALDKALELFVDAGMVQLEAAAD